MPSQSIILAQLFPNAGVETLLYQVANRGITVLFQGITISNHSASQDSLKVSISVGGGATTAKDYVYFNIPINGNDTLLAELDFIMNPTDIIRVVSANGTCSFTLLGFIATV